MEFWSSRLIVEEWWIIISKWKCSTSSSLQLLWFLPLLKDLPHITQSRFNCKRDSRSLITNLSTIKHFLSFVGGAPSPLTTLFVVARYWTHCNYLARVFKVGPCPPPPPRGWSVGLDYYITKCWTVLHFTFYEETVGAHVYRGKLS